MLERLRDLPPGVEGLRAVGKVSKEDYEQTMLPLLDEYRSDGRRLRFLYELGPEFEGFTAGAAWEDARIGLHSLRLFDGCAIVSDIGWIRESTRLIAFVLPCPTRVFGDRERGAGVEWLKSLPEGPAVSHLLLPSGVIVAEVKQALRAQDFDALALTADTWIESHGSLRGLVIHAREFPGWENLGSFFRHLRFIRNHHRNVDRVALAVDGRLASLAPRLADHFVKAEMKNFPYDEIDNAIAWAGQGDDKGATPASHD